MSKGDADTRVKDREAYNANLDKIQKAKSVGYCRHHVHKSMKCRRCDNA